jgi:hypothetical protein
VTREDRREAVFLFRTEASGYLMTIRLASPLRGASRTSPVGVGRHNYRFHRGKLRRTDEGIEGVLRRIAAALIAGRGAAVVTISLNQMNAGTWAIRRCQTNLFRDLTLGSAISLAREIARDEHRRMGYEVSVEMPGPTSAVVLAHYTSVDANAAVAMAA